MLLLAPAVLRVVAGIGGFDGAGDQGQALDQGSLDQGRKSLGVLSDRFLEHLHPEVDVSGLVTRDGCEAPVEPVVRQFELPHGLELEALPGESQRALLTLLSNLPGMAYRCQNDADWTMKPLI